MATFPQNLALICLTVCEKMRFTDGQRTADAGRTPDASAIALALLTQSSRAKKEISRGARPQLFNVKDLSRFQIWVLQSNNIDNM